MAGGPLRRLQELAAGLRWQAGTFFASDEGGELADVRQSDINYSSVRERTCTSASLAIHTLHNGCTVAETHVYVRFCRGGGPISCHS
jgi:hypothetical protein